jgi:lysophospholipase L1-like esterase
LALADEFVPFWKKREMSGESLLFTRPSDDQPASARVGFTPQRIRSLRLATETMHFEHIRDYEWSPGTCDIRLTGNTRIPSLTQSQLYPERGSQLYGTCRDRDNDLLYDESGEFHRVQCLIDYECDGSDWPSHVPAWFGGTLPQLAGKLSMNATVHIAVLGDSISVGMNASGFLRMLPYSRAYVDRVAAGIRAQFGNQLDVTNLSVAGKDSAWALSRILELSSLQPDLVILAFGMNDATIDVPVDTFAGNIRSVIDETRSAMPEVEFIIVSTSTGNPEWTGTRMERYLAYREAVSVMTGEGRVIADVTSAWQQLVGRKKYVDLTGNGLNHPNDFGHRVYADVILDTILKAV